MKTKSKTFERYLQSMFHDMLERFVDTNPRFIDNFVKEFFTFDKFETWNLREFTYKDELRDFIKNVNELGLGYYETSGKRLVYRFFYFFMSQALYSAIETKRLPFEEMKKKVKFILTHKIKPTFVPSSEVGKNLYPIITIY